MKKIKKLVTLVLVGAFVGLGATHLTTVEASACDKYGPHKHIAYNFGDYPNMILSTTMINQYSVHVKKVQEVLNQIGYNAGTPDGFYGSNTYNAVYNYQADHFLDKDAKVGPNTWYSIKVHCSL